MSTPSVPEESNPSSQPMNATQAPPTSLPGAYPAFAAAPPRMAQPAPSAQEYLAMLNQNLRLTESGMIYRDPQTLAKRPLATSDLDSDEDELPRRKHKVATDKAIEIMERKWQSSQGVSEEFTSSMQDDQVSQQEVDRLLQSISLEGHDAVGDLDQCVMAQMLLKCKIDKLGNPVVPGMKVSLMPHQLIGVKWMVEREKNPEFGKKSQIDNNGKNNYGKVKEVSTVGGGILADEMGLGKTIQSIAVMCHNRPDEYEEGIKTTLIVAPLALIHQWKREIEKRTRRGTFRVHLQHGSSQLREIKELAKYDVVITTYSTLMTGYPLHLIPKRRNMDEHQRAYYRDLVDQKKGIMFQMEWFRIILDEAHYIKNPSVRSSVAVGNLKSRRKWCLTGTPIHNCLTDIYPLFRFLEVPLYRNIKPFKEDFVSGGDKKAMGLMQVVLRGMMIRRKKNQKVNGRPLIILPEKTMDMTHVEFNDDERALYTAVEERSRVQVNNYLRQGRAMKNYSSILAMLVRLRQLCIHPFLIMEHMRDKWTVDDLAKVMKGSAEGAVSTKLLEMVDQMVAEPAGDWTECPLCLDNPANPVMTTCRHVFCSDCINGVFEMPAARGQVAGEEDEDVEELGDSIACPVCRHKLARENIGKFTPPPPANQPAPKLDPEEARELYKKVKWEEIVDDSDDDLPDLATAFSKMKEKEKAIVPSKPETPEPLTPVTMDLDTCELKDDEDFLDFFNRNAIPKKEIAQVQSEKATYWETIRDSEEFLPSAKLTALRDQVTEWRLESPDDKIIIFSQFVKALDLVERICDDEGWRCARYHGDLTLDQRETALRDFEDDDEISMMLTSIKCGGVGLNLTVANRVINLDLWWNWQVENQAIDRCHRTGQKKPVFVARIIVKKTVEDRILELQEKKKAIAETALGDDPTARMGRLSLRELIGLFGRVTRDQDGNMQVEE